MEKKNQNLIIIVLSLLVLGLAGYIVYDKTLSNNGTDNNDAVNESNNSNANNNNNSDNTIDNNRLWIEYILNQDIESATLYHGGAVWGTERKMYTLTKEELTELFKQVEDTSVEKVYSGGFGGPGRSISIEIVYQKDNIKYTYTDSTFIHVKSSKSSQKGYEDYAIIDFELLEIIENNSNTRIDKYCSEENSPCSLIYKHNMDYENTSLVKKIFNITE